MEREVEHRQIEHNHLIKEMEIETSTSPQSTCHFLTWNLFSAYASV